VSKNRSLHKVKKSLITTHIVKLILATSLLSFIAPSSAHAVPNVLTPVVSASAAASQLVGVNSGITITGSPASTFGSVKSFDSIDLGTFDGTSYALNSPGIFLTSHTSSPFGANNQPESQALRTQMKDLWELASPRNSLSVQNVSSLSFEFETSTATTTSISLDFLFASTESSDDEYDIALVIVDGVNYAFFPGNKVLRVSQEFNLDDLTNLGVSLNTAPIQSAAPAQTLVALLDPSLSTHSITIAVGDTEDEIIPSMLMVSTIQETTAMTFGVLSLSTTEPDAPTIGTATATGSTTATVAFTAPASDGGETIISYTATSNPGNITATIQQAGSGSILVTGLSPATSYTFTVTAVNSVGTSVASATSNSITTSGVGRNPTFSTPSSFDYRFTVQVTNYDAAYTYSVSSTAGQASISSTGLVTVTGIRVEQSATITVIATRTGYDTGSASITGASQVAPMRPGTKPVVTISDTLITCAIGSYSATPTSTAFSLFVDGKHVSTIFSAVGEYLPDWIIPWATSESITRTASLTRASWTMTDAYKGKSITCATLAYSKNAIGLTAS
jgi:hypothetical protein